LVECFYPAVVPDANTACESNAARVWYTENAKLGGVAGGACINQVRIFQPSVWVFGDGDKMLNMKRGSPAVPLLAVQAIDASEHEFISDPIAVALVILITSRAVPPDVRHGWVLEALHHTPFFRMVAVPKTRSSSSSRILVGRSDTLSK
jgi:hypothetical protein